MPFAAELPGIRLAGLHCYDGNHNNKDFSIRNQEVKETDEQVEKIMERLQADGLAVRLLWPEGRPPSHAICRIRTGMSRRGPRL